MRFALIFTISAFFASAVFAGDGFDYLALRNLIRDQKISSIEELLPQLPEDFLVNYVLMYESREDPSQAATKLKPRTFLYGDGKSGLVISFTGDPEKRGYGNIEISQFDSKTAKFDFKEITFKNGQVEFLDGIDHPSPPDCLRCHMQEKPIWDDIMSAPGAYGGRASGLTGTERENFANFVRTNKHDARYSHLKGLDEKGEAYLARKPAERMARIVMEQNQKRIARMIHELPGYETYRFEIAAAFSGVPVEDHLGGDFEDYLAKTTKALNWWHESNVKLTVAETGVSTDEAEFPMPDLSQEAKIARLRMIIEGKLGINMKNWSTTFRVGSFTQVGWDEVLENLRQEDPKLDALLTEMKKYSTAADAQEGFRNFVKLKGFVTECDELLKKP